MPRTRAYVQEGTPATLEQYMVLQLLEGLEQALHAGSKPESFIEFVNRVYPRYVWYKHNKVLARKLQRVSDGEIKRLLISEPPRHGKALADDTPIATPDGWKAIGQLQRGDVVFAGDGTPTRVVNVWHWQDRPTYQVTSDDGHGVVADAEHEWVVRLCKKRKHWGTYTTRQLAERRGKRKPLLPTQPALRLPEARLPVPPYVLGLWLGDGDSNASVVTAGDADREELRAHVEAEGWATRERPASPGTFLVPGLRPHLRRLGVLNNKHVPREYLRSSVDQRMSLLQGLVDSDGHVSPEGQVEFTSTSEALAGGVLELVHSLGYKASVRVGRATLDGRDCGPRYRVTFYAAQAARLTRKAARCRRASRTPGRYISVEPAATCDTTCIEVEHSSHVFLAGRGMLPTHNSLTVSRLFPAYYLDQHPEHFVAMTAYSADLASGFSRSARQFYQDGGGMLNPLVAAVRHWETLRGGGMFASGIGGGITGKGFNLGIIDDPLKDAKQASSETIRAGHREWYDSTFATRQEPGAAIIITLTRWHMEDVAGHALKQYAEEGWHVVSLDALHDPDDRPVFPVSAVVEPDWRAKGEALCPERYDQTRLEQIRSSIIPYYWNALFQQNPKPREGGQFKRAWFKIIKGGAPKEARRVLFWDLAATTDGGDHTAGVLIAYWRGNYVVERVFYFQKEPGIRDREIRLQCRLLGRQYGPTLRIGVEQEPGSAGVAQARSFRKMLRGLRTFAQVSTGSKVDRADPLASQAQLGNVYLVDAGWNEPFLTQLAGFGPASTEDDMVDAASGAFNTLHGRWSPGDPDAFAPVNESTTRDTPTGGARPRR